MPRDSDPEKSNGPQQRSKLFSYLKANEQLLITLWIQNNFPPVELVPIPVADGQSLAAADRCSRLFLFIARCYPREVAWEVKLAFEGLPTKLSAIFSAENPDLDPVNAAELRPYLVAYFRLVNGFSAPQDILFADTTVQRLYEVYIEQGDAADAYAAIEPNPSLVSAWLRVFDTFLKIPVKLQTETPSSLSEFLTDNFGWFQNGSGPAGSSVKLSQNKGDKDPRKDAGAAARDRNMRVLVFFLWGVGGGLLLMLFYASEASDTEITFQEFSANFLRRNMVSRLRVVNNKTVIVELNENGKSYHAGRPEYHFSIGSVETFERNLKAMQNEYNIPDLLRVPVLYVTEGSLPKILLNFLPTLLFLGAIYYITKKVGAGGIGSPMSFAKSTAKKFNQEANIKTKFKDVAGMDEAKLEVMEFVKFLQNPHKYEKLGAKIPRGAILSGPPGTGKTLIARATAGEANVPFYSVSGSEFVEMFVGVGASRVRDLFKTARENAPSIIFVDEIDAIGKQRSKGNTSGANDERETTLNQLLVEMDGFDTSDHVVVLAGTNRPDILDRALLRPGRFDRHIYIDNPELEGRKLIFKVHLKKITLEKDIESDLAGRLAALTPGFSGADIANVCNEAALIAARFHVKAVGLKHFEFAIERVIGGVEKKSKLLSPNEKRVVAYHEAGHAVCGWFLEHALPLLKVSIIPRGLGVLGYAQYLPADQHLMSTFDLYDRMVMMLGGRVSEELNFSSVTGGAHDDFQKVTKIAQSMVLRFGMSPKVGMVNYADTRSDDSYAKPFSDETNKIIDSEVKRIVQECYERCRQLLTEKAGLVDLVAQELLRKEFITREDMISLLGKRPFPEKNDAFDKYLAGKDAFKNANGPATSE